MDEDTSKSFAADDDADANSDDDDNDINSDDDDDNYCVGLCIDCRWAKINQIEWKVKVKNEIK